MAEQSTTQLTSKKSKLKKWLRLPAAFIAGFFGLFLIFFIALNIFIAWLNTDEGGQWITAQLNTSIKSSGYVLSANDFSLLGVTGIQASSFELQQNNRVLLTAENIGLAINPISLATRSFSLYLVGETLNIKHSPDNDQTTTSPKTTVHLPDLYFNQAYINIDIEKLMIDESMIEGGLQSSLQLEQYISRQDQTILADGVIAFNSDHPALSSPYTPKRIETALEYNVSKSLIHIKHVALINDLYDASLNGDIDLAQNTVALNSSAYMDDPSALSSELSAPINLDLSVTGTFDDLLARYDIRTTYKEQPLALTGELLKQDNIIVLQNINAQSDLIAMNGHIDVNLETSHATGQLTSKIQDLSLLNMVAPDLNLHGSATSDITLSVSDQGTQSMKVTSIFSNLKWQDISATTAQAGLSVADVRDIKNYQLEVSARTVQTGRTTLTAIDATIIPRDVGHDIDLRLNGKHIDLFTAVANAHLKSTSPVDVELNKFALEMGETRMTGSGLIKDDRIDITANARPFNVGELAFIDTQSLPPLRFERLNLALSNTLSNPVFEADYQIRPAMKKEGMTALLRGQTTYQNGQLSTNITGEGTGIKEMTLKAFIPMDVSLRPFHFELDQNSPLSGRIVNKADIGALTTLLLDEGYTIDGMLDINTTLSGSLNNPQLNGTLAMQNARFIDSYNDIAFIDITGNARFANRKITLNEFKAFDQDKKGHIQAQGFINFETIDEPQIDLTLTAQNLNAYRSANFDARLNADMVMTGGNGNYLIKGEFAPEEVNITIPDQFFESIPQLNTVQKDTQKGAFEKIYDQIELDLIFNAKDRIFITGRGLDAETAGKLDVTGRLNAPNIEGKLNTIRGRYAEFGRVFDLPKAELTFRGRIPPSPFLDITAATEVEGVTAQVNITGSYQSPDIGFSSIPARPKDEVLSLILFGRNINDISPFQAIQLADTMRRFSGQGGGAGLNPVQKLRETVGLDDLRVEGMGTGETTIGAGKYLTDKVYVEVEQGSGETATSAASVEVEITPNITMESKTTQSGESDLGVFWEWDY